MTLTSVILILFIAFGTVFIFRLIRSGSASSSSKPNHNRYSQSSQKKNRRTPNRVRPNRYHRNRNKTHSATLGSNPLHHYQPDTDSVLGLYDEVKSKDSGSPAENPLVNEVLAPIVYYIVADKDCPYSGYELLQTLLSCGLRYGDMNIFHRHEAKTGSGKVLFSLASATAPGTFDLATMGGVSCSALVLILNLQDVADPIVTYELLLDTADQLIEDLGGEVLDEHKERLTKGSVLQQRQLIRQFIEARCELIGKD